MRNGEFLRNEPNLMSSTNFFKEANISSAELVTLKPTRLYVSPIAILAKKPCKLNLAIALRLTSRRALPPSWLPATRSVSVKLEPIRKTLGDSLEIVATASRK
jgi:hypothetical protein